MRCKVATVVPVVAVALALGACSTSQSGTARPEPSAASAPSSTTSTTTSQTSSAPAPTPAFAFTTERVAGSTDRVDYDVAIPQVTGGDPAAADKFNQSMRNALQDQIDGFDEQRFALSDSRPAPSHIGAQVISAGLNTSWDARPPGAHPSSIVATITIDSSTASPVTLQDLFPNLQAGLRRLTDQSSRLLPQTAAGPDFAHEGIEPKVQNFANWIALPQGMNIRFGDGQVGPHAAGLVDVTIPWDSLADVADPRLLDVVRS